MKFKEIILGIVMAIVSGVAISSCKTQMEKDAETKLKIQKALPGVVADVQNNHVILSGEVQSKADEAYIVKFVEQMDGIKSVVNHARVANSSQVAMYSMDNQLITTSAEILKSFPGVNASIKNGVICLEGSINKADWSKLAPRLALLHPKQLQNKLSMN